jgi:biopolymer transport protein ExbD
MRRLTNLGLVGFVLVLLLAMCTAAYAGEVEGRILTVNPQAYEFVVKANTNETTTFRMDEDAQVFINDEEASLEDLRAGDMVTVTCRQDGELWFAIEVRCKR